MSAKELCECYNNDMSVYLYLNNDFIDLVDYLRQNCLLNIESSLIFLPHMN